MKTSRSEPCPCNPQRAYAQCCGLLHRGDATAADAEQLMRSRYSAYARRLPDYLLATWHPHTRPETLELEDDPAARLRWLGLDVHEHHVDGPDHARVRFTARFRHGGQPAQRMRELSRFERVQGVWYYLDGVVD